MPRLPKASVTIKPIGREASGGGGPGAVVASTISCAITYPTAGASPPALTPITIRGTISAPGTVVVSLGSTVLGAATVSGLAWSYVWMPQNADAGSQTLNVLATSAAGGTGSAPGVAVTVRSVALVAVSGFTAIGVTENSWWGDTGKFTLTGSAPNQYVARDRYARLRILTSDTSMVVETVKPATAFIDGTTVDVWVNGTYNQTILYGGPVSTKQQTTITLPAGANKIVELYDFAAITGVSVTGSIILPAAPARAISIFGASGSMAQFGWLPLSSVTNTGTPVWTVTWPALVRNSGRFDAMYNASTGSFGTSSFGIGVGNQAPFIANYIRPRKKGTSQNVYVLEMGAGDMELNVSTPTNFAIMMGQTADSIRVEDPAAIVIIQSPIIYTSVQPNSLGFNMVDYAVGLPAVCAARAPWCLYADGMQMASDPGDLFDHLHVFPSKHQHIADYYLGLVGA